MRLIIRYIFILLATVCVNAQTVQLGVVKEYNEKDQKTPLAGVELNVRSAQSTVSDKKGDFSLNFLTLKPGEKINVRRIEKLGYEVFNKEAIEQWNLNPTTPFLIVMCRSERFKKIRDNYEKVSSTSYARQLKKEEAYLAKLKADGKLKEEDYQKQLFKLREDYENQLDNLDSYIDRFSRIDLSELSAIEQEIIELIQNGKIEEAITKYEEQNFVDKYAQEVSQIREISNAIDKLEDVKFSKEFARDSLLASINRQIETLKIAGGKENLDKIGTILHEVYLTDTLNYVILRKFADYLYDIKQFNEALPLYTNLKESKETRDRAHALNRLVLVYKDLEQYEKAINESLNYEALINSTPDEFKGDEIIGIYLNRGLIYLKCSEINQAIISLNEALNISSNYACSPLTLASVKNSLASILCSEHKYEEATSLYKSILDIYLCNDDSSEESNERICGILMNYAQTYRALNDYENAKQHILRAIDYGEKAYRHNPYKHSSTFCMALNTAGNIFSDNNENISVEYYNQAIQIIYPQYEKYPSLFWRAYYQPYANLAIYHTKAKDYSKASDIFEKVIEIVKKTPESSFKNKTLSEVLYNYSYIFCITEEFQKAIPLLNESLFYAESLFEYNKRYGANQYLISLSNLAYCQNKIGGKKVLDSYILGKRTIEQLDLCDTPPFNSKYADFIYNIAHYYHNRNSNYIDAIPHYLKAYSIYESLNSVDDMLEASVGLSESYLLQGNLNMASEWINKVNNMEKCYSHIGWLHTKGLIALEYGDEMTAIDCKNRILSLNPAIDTEEMELFNRTAQK